MKKGIIIILAILLTVGVGFLLPIIMQSNADSIIKGKPKETVSIKETPVVPGTQSVTGDAGLQTPKPSSAVKYTSDVSLETSQTSVPKTTSNSVSNADSGSGKSTPGKDAAASKDIKPTPAETKEKQSGSWVDRKIQEHRDEISEDDLADFRRIYSSVDIGYIQGLMKDGLDSQESTQLKSYLRSTLGGDYERAKELFYEYSYLLSEV